MADDDLASALVRYHHELVVPEIDRAINALSDRVDMRFREVVGHIDHVYKRLDTIESELVAEPERRWRSEN